MKLLAIALAAAMCAPTSNSAPRQDLTGDWVGAATEDMPYTLVLHVGDEVRLDSPDQGLFGILGLAHQNGGQVHMVFANTAAFDGVLKGDRLSGEYLRGPAALPLVFQRKHHWLAPLASWFRR